ncbi:TonB-dependent receptor plug domain-containing protein [Pseudomonas aeruginosa]|nr:TonB-dependent receptor plug domain-containing protein [Pseudomonas aeruginosa]
MTLALAGAAPALLAAEAPAASSARSCDIAPGPLGRTLSAFASDNGVSLAFDPALTEGRRSAALRGRYAPVEALHRLLLGSGLELQQRSDGSYTLVPATTDGALELQSSLITAQAAGAETLPAEYAGGQVARGARLGMLGNADVMDAPFSITSYTARTIEQQQARSVADLLQANDPSVRVVGGRGDLVDSYTIRGFSVQNADVAFNGLYGLLPFWRVPIEFAERVEVLKGPNALLGGISPGGSARRHHQPGAQARRRPAADPRQRRLDPARPARHSPRHRPTLWREQRLRRALQRRLPQRRYRRRPSEPRVSHALPGPGLPWRAPAPVQRPAVPEGKPGRRGAPAADRPGNHPHPPRPGLEDTLRPARFLPGPGGLLHGQPRRVRPRRQPDGVRQHRRPPEQLRNHRRQQHPHRQPGRYRQQPGTPARRPPHLFRRGRPARQLRHRPAPPRLDAQRQPPARTAGHGLCLHRDAAGQPLPDLAAYAAAGLLQPRREHSEDQ